MSPFILTTCPDDHPGRLHPLVRLVRFQRRQRPGGQRPGGFRLHRNAIAAAAATLSWVITEWMYRGKPPPWEPPAAAWPDLWPSPGRRFCRPLSAVIIGLTAGGLCYFAIFLKHKLGYDVALDVVGVHGGRRNLRRPGHWLFASKAVNEAGKQRLIFRKPGASGPQALAVGVTLIYSFVLTLIILKVWIGHGLRVETKRRWPVGYQPAQRSGYNL